VSEDAARPGGKPEESHRSRDDADVVADAARNHVALAGRPHRVADREEERGHQHAGE